MDSQNLLWQRIQFSTLALLCLLWAIIAWLMNSLAIAKTMVYAFGVNALLAILFYWLKPQEEV